MWNEKDMWRGQGMCVGGSAVGVRRQRVLYSIGSLVTGRKNGQLHHMLRAFWQTYVWDGPSEDVSKAVLGGGAWTFWTEFWNSYLFPWDHDFKASIPFFFLFKKKKKGWKPWKKKKSFKVLWMKPALFSFCQCPPVSRRVPLPNYTGRGSF